MKNLLTFFLAWLACLVLTVCAKEDLKQVQSPALAISVAFDAEGNIWRVSVKDGIVQVDVSHDLGQNFSTPIPINLTPQNIVADIDTRPNIVIGPEGNIFLTWTAVLKNKFSDDIWFARSSDQGKTFEKSVIVHQDRAESSHIFNTLNVASNGHVTVTWIDSRDQIATKSEGKNYKGAAIYYAVSINNGVTFNIEQKLADNSCECCSIVTASKPGGAVVAMWPHIFEGSEHDYMIAEIPFMGIQGTVIKRATFEHRKSGACSQQGAAIATGGEGIDWWGYHMAYSNGNDVSPKLLYSRMDGVAWASSPPKKFGNTNYLPEYPAILSLGEKVWLVWRETEAKKNTVFGVFSEDGGRSWGDVKLLAVTTDSADSPHLISNNHQIYLVWNTLKEGFKLIEL